MHSRAVLLLSLFTLVCLILVGGIMLHMTSASASTDETAAHEAMDVLTEIEADSHSAGSSNLAFFRDASRPGSSDSEPAELSHRDRSSADSLESLLREVHVMFEPEGSGVSNAMIPYLAEMITIINQYEHLVYRIEIVEPDAALARRRAQTLNDVLRLNVLDPSNLRIVGRQGLHAALVDVSAL